MGLDAASREAVAVALDEAVLAAQVDLVAQADLGALEVTMGETASMLTKAPVRQAPSTNGRCLGAWKRETRSTTDVIKV
jgi:hypothetical protein